MLNKIHILGTGSKGNCYILHFDNGQIQLESGLKNENLKDVNYLLISHLHEDHFPMVSYKKYKGHYLKTFFPSIEKFQNIYENKKLENCFISMFNVPHIVPNVGFHINFENENILYITDCGDILSLIDTLKNITCKLTYLIIEVNYDSFQIKGSQFFHKDYVVSNLGHSSNVDVLKFLSEINLPRTCKILFIHRSENHTNSKTYTIFDILPYNWIVAKNKKTIYCKPWEEI